MGAGAGGTSVFTFAGGAGIQQELCRHTSRDVGFVSLVGSFRAVYAAAVAPLDRPTIHHEGFMGTVSKTLPAAAAAAAAVLLLRTKHTPRNRLRLHVTFVSF